MKTWPVALALVLLPTLHASAESVVVETILRTTETASGKPITVPANPELIVSTYDIEAHTRLPLHKHPHARYAYVLDGAITVEVRGGDSYHYKAGDFIVEVIGEWHVGITGDEAVRLLVIDQTEPGEHNTVLWGGDTPK